MQHICTEPLPPESVSECLSTGLMRRTYVSETQRITPNCHLLPCMFIVLWNYGTFASSAAIDLERLTLLNLGLIVRSRVRTHPNSRSSTDGGMPRASSSDVIRYLRTFLGEPETIRTSRLIHDPLDTWDRLDRLGRPDLLRIPECVNDPSAFPRHRKDTGDVKCNSANDSKHSAPKKMHSSG